MEIEGFNTVGAITHYFPIRCHSDPSEAQYIGLLEIPSKRLPYFVQAALVYYGSTMAQNYIKWCRLCCHT